MEYSIGDVSKILNVSKEMIRYYEKQGALSPSRIKENNYRTYSTMDIFFLMEMIRYQAVGLSVKEITNLLENNYMINYANYLDKYYKELENEINFKCLLKERIKEMANRAKTSQMNLGKFWFKQIPMHDLVFLCDSYDDNYDKIALTQNNRQILFSNHNFAFFESIVLFEEKRNTWWYGINKNYASSLLLNYESTNVIQEQLCLCTMVNMGEVGEFNRDLLTPILDYIKSNHYTISGTIQGMIVCRGYHNGKFQRILEIQVPIKH